MIIKKFKEVIKTSISNRIMLTSLLSVLIISTLSTGISFYMSSNLLKNKIIEINARTLKQNVVNIESILSKVEMYIASFLDDQSFNNLLTKYLADSDKGVDNLKNLEGYLYEMSSSCKEIQFFYLVTPNNELVTNDQTASKRLDYEYFSNKFKQADKFSWSYMNYKLTYLSDSILLTKRILNFSTGKDIGIISITINNNYIMNFMDDANRGTGSFSMLTNEFKPVMSTITIPKSDVSMLNHVLSNDSEGTITINGSIYLFCRSFYTGWIGLSRIESKSFIGPIVEALQQVIIVFIVCILFSLTVGSIYAGRFRTSVNKLSMGMKKAVNEHLDVQVKSRHILHINRRNSLLILFSITILLPILTSITYTYYIFTGVLKNQTVSYFNGALNTLKSQIISSMDSYEQAAHYITFNDIVLQTALINYDKENVITGQNSNIDRLILMQQKIRSGAFYINIVNNKDQQIYSTIPMNGEILSKYTKIMDTLIVPKKFYETHKDYYNQYVITLGKRIFNVNSPENGLGYLLLNMYEKDLCNLYSKNMTGDAIDTFIIDKQGNIISENNKDLIGKNIRDINPNFQWPDKYLNSGSFSWKSGGKDYLIDYTHLGNLDWILVSSVVIQDFLKSSLFTVNLYIFIISAIFVVMVSFLMANNISKPLRQLKESINKVSYGDFDQKFTTESGDEIEELSHSFNKMVSQLRTLIKESYESKIEKQRLELQKKEAEFLAFQAQIHPHFLYNTLEVIHCKAMFITGGDNDVSFIISKLSDFLRFVTAEKGKYIRLKDEVQHSRNYIDIMKSCGSNISIDWRIDDNVLNYKVPELILQPLLENSINHGLQHAYSQEGRIYVKIKERNNVIVIMTVDNGIGISHDKLHSIRTSLNNIVTGSHVGLKNIHQRIILGFGPEYGISIRSKLQKGTVVRIQIPKIDYSDDGH